MQRLILSVFFIFVLGLSTPSLACQTTNLLVAGNLDSRLSFATLPASEEPIDSQVSSANHAETVILYDNLGVTHTLTIAFFHISENRWVARFLFPEGELAGGGSPTLISIVMDFSSSGERLIPPSNDSDFFAQPLLWSSGGSTIFFSAFLDVVNTASDLSLSLSQNGSAGGCSESGNIDYDGDGVDDYGVFRPAQGLWIIALSSTGTSIVQQWGLPGDIPMSGDYTGDGKADLVVWRPSNGTWYLCSSESNFSCSNGTSRQWGLPDDIPIKGDFDGDRVLDYAVWRPSNGTYYSIGSFNEQVSTRQWGLPGDIPLQGGLLR